MMDSGADLEPVIRIRTPENVEFVHALAGPATRFFAWVVDLVLMIGGILLIVLACIPMGIILGPFTITAAVVGSFVWSYGYSIWFEFFQGATPGKKRMGLAVLSQDGLPIDFWQALLRNLIRTVDFLTPIYLIGGTASLLDRFGRRLGDLAAGTVVVRVRQNVQPSEVMAPNERYNTLLDDPYVTGLLRRGLRAEERELLIDLCVRRNELELGARLELFRKAADILRARFPLPVDSRLSDERLVVNVAAVILTGERRKS